MGVTATDASSQRDGPWGAAAPPIQAGGFVPPSGLHVSEVWPWEVVLFDANASYLLTQDDIVGP